MESVNQMKRQLAEVVTKAKALRADLEKKGPAATAEEHSELAKLVTQGQELKTRITTIIEVDALDAFANEPEERMTSDGVQAKQRKAVRKRWARLKHISGDSRAEAEETAYRFGMWFMGGVLGDAKAAAWCKEHGIEIKAQKESVNAGGGFLVPDEFDNQLIDLRETYGVFRSNARIRPMMRDTKNVGRRNNGLTAYFVGESQAGTESDKGWDQISLTAKKLMTLTRVSSELAEDAVVNLADDLAGEIGYAFALKEDQCGFLGDGGSTFGGIVGLAPKMLSLSGTIANIAGLVVASGNLFSEFVLADFNAVVGKLPEYADARAKWYTSRFFWASVMQRLALAAGGVTAEEIEGKRTRTFLGYPVEVVQVMPKTDANSQVACWFGDLSSAASFGDRRQTTVAISEDRYFDTDEIGIKGTERFDITCHDLGNADATAANRVEGPIIGLISAAS